MIRPFLPLILLLTPVLGMAQRQVRIIDPVILDIVPDVRKTKGAEAGLAAAGVITEQRDLVLQYGDRAYWPEGIRNDSARAANQPYIRNYTAFRVCTYPLDSVPMAVVMVPAPDNIHMPEEMRPLADFYLVLPEKTLEDVNSSKQRPTISRGPRWKNLPVAQIVKTDDLYASYDLGSDSIGIKELLSHGLSQAEVDAVVFRSHEANWPAGINTFDRRYPRIKDFKKYKAFVGAKWDDKVLLIIPAEKNRGMATVMRPYVDLYFVYAASAVEVKGKKKR
ncbi:MAG TPA: hypothetical protein VGE21_04715 [Flavobacteriales bacterium]